MKNLRQFLLLSILALNILTFFSCEKTKKKQTVLVDLLESGDKITTDNLEKFIDTNLSYAQSIKGIRKLINLSEFNIALKNGQNILSIYIHDTLKIAQIHSIMGEVYSHKGLYQKSLEARERALLFYLSQYDSTNIKVLRNLNFIGACYSNLGNYSKSEEYSSKVLAFIYQLKIPRDTLIIEVNNSLGLLYIRNGKLEKALTHLNESISLSEKKLLSFPDPYLNRGLYYKNQGENEKALQDYEKALNISLKKYGTNHPRISKCQNNIGIIFHEKGEFSKAVIYYEKAVESWKNSIGEEHRDIATCYSNIGNVYIKLGDFFKALSYYNQALSIHQKVDVTTTKYTAFALNGVATIYAEKGNYNLAISYYKKAKDILETLYGQKHYYFATLLNNIGDVYLQQKKYAKALQLKSKAFELYASLLPESHPIVINSLYTIGLLHFEKYDYESANYYYQKSIQILTENFGKTHQDIAKIYCYLGALEIERLNYEKAHHYYNKALSCLNFKEILTFNSTNSNSMLYLIEALLLKAELFALLSKKNNLVKSEIDSTLYYYQTAEKISEILKNSTVETNSIQLLIERNYKIYEGIIATLQHLSKLTSGNEHLLRAFQTSEKSKSYLLLNAVGHAKALHFSEIPDSLITKEFEIKKTINTLEKERNNISIDADDKADSLLNIYNSKIFDLKRKYEVLIKTFESQFPEYYDLKHNKSAISIKGVQDSLLSRNQALIEYFVGDSSIFIFTILPHTFYVHEVKKDFPLKQWVEQMRDGIYKDFDKTQSNRTAYNKKYTEAAFNIYNKIFAPIADLFPKETKLIIIPDGILSHIPFDVLLTKEVEDSNNFDSFDYLLKKHPISYAYSATLLKEMKYKKHEKKAAKTMLAVAPFYNGDTSLLASIFPFTRSIQKNLKPLPYSGNEVNGIKKRIGGEVLTHDKATKDAFMKNAEKYKIIHLATHGQANDQTGDYSFLVFAEDPDSTDNQLLYVKDIYDLKLNAEMVVLSACETGMGELQRGEGIISLARGFSYAGAKSIITTLWSVSDKSSSDLMNLFYKNLKSEMTKDKALQKAKKDYLLSSPNIEPYYWAAFIPIGNMEKIELSSPIPVSGWLIGGILGLFLLFIGFRYFKQKE